MPVIWIVVAGLTALGIYMRMQVYRECRAHDFSRFYCYMQMGSRS